MITPGLIAGAFAERVRFKAYCLFIALWGLLVYNPLCHWVWGIGGFLKDMGALDFAGGTVVHINAGIAGLVCALFLGKRYGYGSENMAPQPLAYRNSRISSSLAGRMAQGVDRTAARMR